MTTTANPFSPRLDAFLQRLIELNYYQFFMGALLGRGTKTMQRDLAHFSEKGWPKDAYFFGAGVPMMDIFHTGEWVVRCPTKARTTLGDDVVRMASETERQFNAFMVVLQYEAIERYLKATYTLLLSHKGSEIKLRKVDAFHNSHTGWEERAGSAEYFEKYAAYACRYNCNAAIDDFERYLNWDRAAIKGCFAMSYHDFVRVLGICRHRIVHNHGKISDEHLGNLTPGQKRFVVSWMSETLHGRERLILPEAKPVDDCFEHLASYGRGLFVLASDFCGMADDTNYFNAAQRAV